MKPPRSSTSAWSWPCLTSSQICRARMRCRSIYFGCSSMLDRKNLRRHLLQRHERPFGGIAAARPRRFVFVAARLQIVLGGLDRLQHQLVPKRQAALGLAQAKVDAGAGEAGRIDPFLQEVIQNGMHFKLRCNRSNCSKGSSRSLSSSRSNRFRQGTRGQRLFSVQTSGGGGTIERPVAVSTMEPSAGQYIKHTVQPG